MNATLRIGGHDFEVVRFKPNDALGNVNIGRMEYDSLRITIDAGMPEWRQRKVLLHELIHAANWYHGDRELCEADVLALENGLWAIFSDNPGLARGIFGDSA